MARTTSSALDKALDLVEAIAAAERPVRLTELAGTVGLHRATAYRVLVDLARRGWVLRAGDHYLLGAAALRLSANAQGVSLAEICRPIMAALVERTGLMVNLQVLEGTGSRVVEVLRPERLEMIAHLRGDLLGVERFAGPLALVAALDAEEREPYLAAAADAGATVDGTGGLRDRLDRLGAEGFALERGQHDRLVASLSSAVLSVKGTPICALTLVGLAADFDEDRLPELQRHLRAAVGEVHDALENATGA